MQALLSVALNTFREAARQRLFVNALVFATLLVGLSLLVGTLSIGAERRITLDIGLAAIALSGGLIAILLGVASIGREIEGRALYALLARPLSRATYLLGKYLGLVAILGLNVALLGGLVALVVLAQGQGLPRSFLPALWLTWLQLCLVGALALFFAAFASTTTLAVICSLSGHLIGSLSADLRGLAERAGSEAVTALARALYYLLPDLSLFSLRTQVANDLPVPDGFVALSSAYGLGYSAVLLTLAVLIFRRRDLT